MTRAPGIGADHLNVWVGARCDHCHRLVDGIPGYEDEEHTTVCVDCVPSVRGTPPEEETA